jgi:hypothetical protein
LKAPVEVTERAFIRLFDETVSAGVPPDPGVVEFMTKLPAPPVPVFVTSISLPPDEVLPENGNASPSAAHDGVAPDPLLFST